MRRKNTSWRVSPGRHARRRRSSKWAIAVVILVIVTGVALRGQVLRAAGAGSRSGFYLVVGASSSLGFQPTGIPHHNGARTDHGYANDVVAIEAAKGMNLTMRQVGCPGETVSSMLSGGDHCYTLPNRQMLTATAFLRQNATQTGLVTIDLGFNDVRPCLTTLVVDVACANAGVATVRADMPAVLRELRAAAGPHVHFVGVLYGDPFLADYVRRGSSPAQAALTLRTMSQLNAALTAAYTAANIPSANVPGAFASYDQAPTRLRDGRVVPTNVAHACAWTWMCHTYPWGPDDHPDDAGYRVIAKAIAAKLPSNW
ncbi:MAG: hypothetical protein ACYCPT_06015 [Acidimicrobiales bacterium]